METTEKTKITVAVTVNTTAEKAWNLWTKPEHITNWNTASEDWHTTKAENDVRNGGLFTVRMESKDGSFGFDFSGIYDDIKINKSIEYTLGDGRKVQITFETVNDTTIITEIFEAEDTNSLETQQTGWQAIMDNFKKYAEAN
ncbi:SRPBCC domain-containing protein [Flavobacterium sp.]|uniref:SRPBCC domain-containing protein n=1 Tax=Flavobacterium sp. TaxID=239 RepID=UPI003D6A1071